MRRKMTELYVKGQTKLTGWKERFLQEEKGASHMVEIVVVIVIVIAVAGIFHEQLQGAIESIFGNLTEFINGSEHSGV